MAAPVQLTPAFKAGNPRTLFAGRSLVLDGRFIGGSTRTYDIASDGNRFLMIKENAAANEGSVPVNMIVVQNWQEELKQRVPAR
jgi:hypothetical protein